MGWEVVGDRSLAQQAEVQGMGELGMVAGTCILLPRTSGRRDQHTPKVAENAIGCPTALL